MAPKARRRAVGDAGRAIKQTFGDLAKFKDASVPPADSLRQRLGLGLAVASGKLEVFTPPIKTAR